MEKEQTIKLTENELAYIVGILTQQPYNEVAELIEKLKNQYMC